MGKDTKIEWAHHTFNPWYGCQKVSPARDHCYAESWAKRSGMVAWGPGAQRRRSSLTNWKQALKWDRDANNQRYVWNKFKRMNPGLTDEQLQAHGLVKPYRPRVFCGSLCDVFDNAVLHNWRIDLFCLICATKNLDWLLPTKRIDKVREWHKRMELPDDPAFLKNVWLGITVCNQSEADRDIPKLLAIPAAKRFLLIEPMLSGISVEGIFASEKINDGTNCLEELDWVIVGGESGPKARPMHPEWARSIRDQCKAAGVPFLFK